MGYFMGFLFGGWAFMGYLGLYGPLWAFMGYLGLLGCLGLVGF